MDGTLGQTEEEQRMTKYQRHALIALCAVGLLNLHPALADQPPSQPGTQQQVGMGGGALLGALVGGPPGLILGAFGGALIGRSQDQADELAQRDAVPDDRQRRLASLEAHDRQTGIELQQARRQQAMLARAIGQGFVYSVQFRTDSARLEPHYQADLKRLAEALALLRALPLDINVHLTGYADARGNDRHNTELSQRRVEVVRAFLLHAGLDDGCIERQAVGETRATAGPRDGEGLFFDRRVHIRVGLREESA